MLTYMGRAFGVQGNDGDDDDDDVSDDEPTQAQPATSEALELADFVASRDGAAQEDGEEFSYDDLDATAFEEGELNA
jgi:hypothetical protein